ncbi:MAG TPA: peroxidase family protein [Chthoniobacterales bacterium]|nr:peroxidase family protein [Chthoniobacterales bacterium]
MLSHYSRLFGGPFAGHDETHLRELSTRMKDIPQNRRGRPRRGDLAPSGFVYLGQFLDHDLTRDETRLEHASAAPERTKNLHVPRLNLESLYGGGPRKSPDLYDHSESGSETFLLGSTEALPRKRIPSTPDDFFRRNGRPLLADNRNDQHLILAQLHVVFLQFHNRMIGYLKHGRATDEAFPNETIFDAARRLVVWHYQWIVRNEFLKWFVLPEVLTDIEKHGPRFFKLVPGEKVPSLPVEFTQAAFRFGHSMVQPQYEINQWVGLVRLSELVRKTRPDEPGEPLPADNVLDWDRFTRTWGGNANFAENIDTLISEDMFNLPAAAMPVPTKTPPPPLPEMTLVRGSRIGLPSGQEACRAAGVQSLAETQVGFDDEGNEFLRDRGLNEKTPLWYYLLREAEVLGIRRFRGGECLGPLGSRIVAEVLLGVMNADPEHYLNVDPNWRPLTAVFGGSNEPRRLDTLRKFVAFAKGRPAR